MSSLATTITPSNQKLGFLNQPFPKLSLFICLVSEFLPFNSHHFNADSLLNCIQGGSASLTCLPLLPSVTRPLCQLCPKVIFDLSNYCTTAGCLSLCVAIDSWLIVMLAHVIKKKKTIPNINSYFSHWAFNPTSSVLPQQNPNSQEKPLTWVLKSEVSV